jgi:hypothetical protein
MSSEDLLKLCLARVVVSSFLSIVSINVLRHVDGIVEDVLNIFILPWSKLRSVLNSFGFGLKSFCHSRQQFRFILNRILFDLWSIFLLKFVILVLVGEEAASGLHISYTLGTVVIHSHYMVSLNMVCHVLLTFQTFLANSTEVQNIVSYVALQDQLVQQWDKDVQIFRVLFDMIKIHLCYTVTYMLR